ncbi:MAG: NADH-quinone oxidoreductase subunit H, partial [Cyanobacteria bacterium]|nr:NADH-quinone oxidoreductase subunit H [Cyanobacteriota bacterium]
AAVAVLIALSSPWLPGMPVLFHSDVFLFVYLFASLRFFTVLSSLDTGSPFGGFAASREVTLAVLVEPANMLCLAALAVVAKSTSLTEIFSYGSSYLSNCPALWIMAGCGLFLTSLVELSRMPADDPTTHLELTMVHEAMILENSGPNLALTEYAAAVKLLVLMGLTGQCFLHAVSGVWTMQEEIQTIVGLTALFTLVGLIAVFEATAVKLRWTKLPEFIAYAVTFGLLCLAFVVGAAK